MTRSGPPSHPEPRLRSQHPAHPAQDHQLPCPGPLRQPHTCTPNITPPGVSFTLNLEPHPRVKDPKSTLSAWLSQLCPSPAHACLQLGGLFNPPWDRPWWNPWSPPTLTPAASPTSADQAPGKCTGHGLISTISKSYQARHSTDGGTWPPPAPAAAWLLTVPPPVPLGSPELSSQGQMALSSALASWPGVPLGPEPSVAQPCCPYILRSLCPPAWPPLLGASGQEPFPQYGTRSPPTSRSTTQLSPSHQPT